MRNSHLKIHLAVAAAVAVCLGSWCAAQSPQTQPDKVYVPYEQLKGVFETEKQGIFLPYDEFQRLWRAAQAAPAGIEAAPVDYLISTARFSGNVAPKLAHMKLELTVDILADGWVNVPIGLGEVAVAEVRFIQPQRPKVEPLLRVLDGQYVLLTKGKGRHVLQIDFVRQLVTEPGLNVLSFRIPSAAISTLELIIPEENMKVDVKPMLAATTTQVTLEGAKATKLQAFLGSADRVEMSWKPTTQAAAELEPVVISDQLQHIHVDEALISYEVRFRYDIRRRGVDAFTVQLPAEFRILSVDGDNISNWDIAPAPANEAAPQILRVKLFSAAEDSYALTVKMERFLKDPQVRLPLAPILTQQVLRRTGLIAITHSPRRSVELDQIKNLARVDTGRLPEDLRGSPGVLAYRFITADYGAVLAIASVAPRITVRHLWVLGAEDDTLHLHGRLEYNIERTGVFSLKLNLPEPWELVSVGPKDVVDDHQLSGAGPERVLSILLTKELTGSVAVQIQARAARAKPEEDVQFALPLADAENVRLYSGQLVLHLPENLRAELEKLQQLQSMPLSQAQRWVSIGGLRPAMAFEFRSIDRNNPAGANFKVAVKPPQVSAVVHRLIDIQPGSIEEQAVVQYQIRYAPVDTFYLKMPTRLADTDVRITGPNIKEKPRIENLPADQQPATAETAPALKWAYYKVVLQSPVIGSYQLQVSARRAFTAGEVGRTTTVEILPILAAGKLSDQSGHIAIAKADTLAIGEPASKNLIEGDPGSGADLPYAPHRKAAALAFKYNAPPFELSLPVVTQEEAAVFTTIATAVLIEQVLALDGTLNTHAIWLLATSRGDRLPITLPAGAKLFAVLLNGAEAPVEAGTSPDQRIVRLPPTAGQVAKVVLEVTYSLDDVSASHLVAPALPKEIPVQQTLWRLWVPDEHYLLAFDRVFSRVAGYELGNLLQTLGAGQPSRVAFHLAPQGAAWNFVRQGAPGELSVSLIRKELFSVIVWVILVAAGAAMLKLGGFRRSLVVLAALLLAAVVRLFAPLLIRQFFFTGLWAGGIVVLLWLAHWLFLARPRRKRAAAPVMPVIDKGQAELKAQDKE